MGAVSRVLTWFGFAKPLRPTLAYHLLDDSWYMVPLECDCPIPLTPDEARTVLIGHGRHGCRLGLTARAVRDAAVAAVVAESGRIATG